jgi:hypothetical protein
MTYSLLTDTQTERKGIEGKKDERRKMKKEDIRDAHIEKPRSR